MPLPYGMHYAGAIDEYVGIPQRGYFKRFILIYQSAQEFIIFHLSRIRLSHAVLELMRFCIELNATCW